MSVPNIELFYEDIRGLNGELAQELALSDIRPLVESEYSPEEMDEIVNENEELQERYDDLEEESGNLEQQVEALEEKIKLLTEENLRLKKENYAVGNLLDYVVVERGIDVFEGSGLKP